MTSSDREQEAGAGRAAAGRKDDRAERLARALRENLKRRKQQARARSAAGKPASGETGEGD